MTQPNEKDSGGLMGKNDEVTCYNPDFASVLKGEKMMVPDLLTAPLERLERAVASLTVAIVGIHGKGGGSSSAVEGAAEVRNTDSPFMTLPECAQMVGAEVSTLRKWCMLKKIPFIKVGGDPGKRGGKVMFSRVAIEKWMADKSVKVDPMWRGQSRLTKT